MQRREMRGGAKLVQDLRRDELVGVELRPAIDNAMAYGRRRGMKMVRTSAARVARASVWDS